MVTIPSILLLDEPLLGLDLAGRNYLQAIMAKIRSDLTVLYVTHDLTEVLPYADRLWLVEEGRIVLDCPAELWADHISRWQAAGVRYPKEVSLGEET